MNASGEGATECIFRRTKEDEGVPKVTQVLQQYTAALWDCGLDANFFPLTEEEAQKALGSSDDDVGQALVMLVNRALEGEVGAGDGGSNAQAAAARSEADAAAEARVQQVIEGVLSILGKVVSTEDAKAALSSSNQVVDDAVMSFLT